jgi:hypothetical protein
MVNVRMDISGTLQPVHAINVQILHVKFVLLLIGVNYALILLIYTMVNVYLIVKLQHIQ